AGPRGRLPASAAGARRRGLGGLGGGRVDLGRDRGTGPAMTLRDESTTSAGPAGPGRVAGGGANEPALRVDDLRVTFAGRHGRGLVRAVDGVNLTVGSREIVALIGESGCGKSTLARALVGLVKPTTGQVGFAGRRLRYSSKALKQYRRHTQLVLQDPGGALNPRQNIFDAVAEGP